MIKSYSSSCQDEILDEDLFVTIKKVEYKGRIMEQHWHEQIQFCYIIQGQAIFRCDSKDLKVGPGDILIINSKEIHCTESLDDCFIAETIKIDFSFIFANKTDPCQIKYMEPLSQNMILFKNVISQDVDVLNCIKKIIDEYYSKKIGFELVIKSQVYNLIVLLLRGYIKKIYSEKEFSVRIANLQRFYDIVEYIENHYTEKIDSDMLASMANISTCHFCRLFKLTTGLSATEYINNLRINKAVELITQGDLNVTEVAIACGFSDSNYFSRLFKKYKKISPLGMKKRYLDKSKF